MSAERLLRGTVKPPELAGRGGCADITDIAFCLRPTLPIDPIGRRLILTGACQREAPYLNRSHGTFGLPAQLLLPSGRRTNCLSNFSSRSVSGRPLRLWYDLAGAAGAPLRSRAHV